MKRLTYVSVASIFKISLILGAAAGLLAGLVLMVLSFADKRFVEGLITLALAPILYGVMGGVVNSVLAWVFNLVAPRFGGVDIHLED